MKIEIRINIQQPDDNIGQKYNENGKQRKITILYIINETSTQRQADCITFHRVTSPPINDNNVTKRTVERETKKLTIAYDKQFLSMMNAQTRGGGNARTNGGKCSREYVGD